MLFESFYLYEPCELKNGRFNSVSALWRFPEDANEVSKTLKDVHEFCYPDLDCIEVECPDKSRTEAYSFIIGREFYGILRSV